MSERESDSTPAGGGFLDRAAHAAALFGGSLMLAAGVLIVASIGTRWFLAASIPGDIELIQAATAVAAFAFLPFGQLHRSNIVVDTFTQRLPARVRNAVDAFWDVVYAAAAVILSWRLSVAAFDAIRSHTVSTVIGLPIGWFMLAGVAMLFLLALVCLLTAGRLLRGSN
jgi:TRAP-type C4-dicarboxylate transport system permease small subunit